MPPLQVLHASGHEIALVITQPDKKRGRGGELSPTPVKAAAQALGIPVSHRVKDIADLRADLGVVVAFGRLIKPEVLASLDFLNLHFSLLPRWRGAAPVERAILAGDKETGVCVMKLEEELDTGPIYSRSTLSIDPQESVEELRRRLVDLGSSELVRLLENPLPHLTPQSGQVTHAAKIDPEELHIDWRQTAEETLRTTRLGRSWTTFRGRRLLIHRARVGNPLDAGETRLAPGHCRGVLVGATDRPVEMIEVQAEGKTRQSAAVWANGARPGPDDRME